MDTTNKHDWGLVIAGVLLVICSMFFLFAPGLALVTITVIAGAAFRCRASSTSSTTSASAGPWT